MQPNYTLEPISAGTSEIQVPVDGRANVGREATNDFSFPHDLQMSSVHFDIGAEPGGCRIRDIGSSNGLFLNAKRIRTAIVVEGDEIQAGGSRWRVVVRSSGVSSSAPQLMITAADGSSRRLTGSQVLIIGRATAAQWIFDEDEQMSSCHMELSHQSGVWKLTDLDSTNGTYVNGSRVSEVQLFSGDEIRGGKTHFEVAILDGLPAQPTPLPTGLADVADAVPLEVELGEATSLPVPARVGNYAAQQIDALGSVQVSHALLRRLSDGQEFDLLPNQLVSLGRSPESLISLASDFEVSTQHATLLFDGNCIQLWDVGSYNGTFVGSRRITEAELAHGDRLRVGKTEFVVCLPQTAGVEASPAMQPAQSHIAAVDVADLPYYSNSEVDDHALAQVPTSRTDLLAADDALAIDPSPITGGIYSEVVSGGMYSEEDSDEVESGVVENATDENRPGEAGPSESGAAESSTGEDFTPPSSDPPPDVENRSERDFEGAIDGSASRSIDLGDNDSYAGQAALLKAVACRSGLSVYLGEAATLQPVDVCLSLLRATSGWVLNGSEIEKWIEAASEGLSGLPREWLNPSRADDASWMLPFLDNWGSGSSWLVFSHVELEDALQSLRDLRQPNEGRQPLIASLNPTSLAELLTEQDGSLVKPFFAPFDAILLEVGAGERWALVGRPELEAILQSSDL